MISRPCRLAPLLAAFVSPAVYAQFSLFVVDGNVERPAPAIYDFGSLYTGELVSAHFRVRNISNAGAALNVLDVAGAGFTLTGPTLPAALPAQSSVDLTIDFRAPGIGSYSAALRSEGISILLTASVLPSLSYQVDTGTGLQPLGPKGVDFGIALRGATVVRHMVIQNQTSQLLTVPAIAVSRGDFSVGGAAPSGTVLQPLQTSAFDLQFTPAAAGARSGSLVIGDRTYPLSGTGQDLPLPIPILTVKLNQPGSLQQGQVNVGFDSPAKTAGSGTITLEFQPAAAGATDPAIVFASGGRNATFGFAAGDTLAVIPFQTGTTAGTVRFTVKVGAATDQQSFVIPAAPAGMTEVQGLRSAGNIEVRVTGFDNTRTLGPLTFTFNDAAGNPIAPGAIRTDASADFTRYFQTSAAGGLFLLRAVFPVTGDANGIASFDVSVTNSAGTAKAARTLF